MKQGLQCGKIKYFVISFLCFFIKCGLFYYFTGIEWTQSYIAIITIAFFGLLFFICTRSRDEKKSHLKQKKIFFAVVYTICSVLMTVDSIYYSYFAQYVSVNQIFQLKTLWVTANTADVTAMIPTPWSLLLLLDLPIVFFCCIRLPERKTIKKQRYIENILFLGIVITIFTLGMNPYDDLYVRKINHLEIFSYHVRDIKENIQRRHKRQTVKEEDLKAVISNYVAKGKTKKLKGSAKGKNLILIQVESLQNFVIGKEYNGQEITPNLNQLLKQDTLYFDHFYSTAGKGNTSDAEFGTLNSFYPNDERECYRMFEDNDFNGIPWILRSLQYDTYAFHGYIKTFWNRDRAYVNQGIQTFYSEEKLKDTEISGFGITDKETIRQMIDILKTKKQPFFSFFITLTNHIPYELPDNLATLNVAPEDRGTFFGNYMQTVRYTDEAIGELIQYLKENDMYDNTMIVLYGDHQGLNKETASVKKKVSQYLGKNYDYDEMMKVPLIIHNPGMGEQKTISTIGGQVDILPTIANLMDLTLEQPYIFGQDLVNIEEKDGYAALIAYMGEGSFAADGIVYAVGRDGSFENGRAIDIETGKYVSLDQKWKPIYNKTLALLETSKTVLELNLMEHYIHHG